MKKTVIVEFNGLSGLGKTTVANILRDDLIIDGYKAIGWYRHSKLHSIHPLCAIPYSFSLYSKVKRYANSIVPFRKERTHMHYTNHFVRMYKSIEKYSDADFAICDEGIIQFLVAMGCKDHFPQTPLLDAIVEKLKSMGVSFVRVDCENHVQSSVERINSRPPRGIFFEGWSKEDLVSLLQVEADNFECLRSVFSKVYPDQKVIKIDTLNLAPKVNALKIKEIITKQ